MKFLVVPLAALLVLPASAAHAAEANRPPDVPANLAVAGIACAGDGIFVGTTTPQITVGVADPDQGDTLLPELALWPAGEPAQRTGWTAPAMTYAGTVFTAVPATLADGVRYELQARATDTAGASSDWTPVCGFTVDTTVPHAPVVTSAEYPEGASGGGVGITGTFTFAVAGGDEDVVTFRYSSETTGLDEVPVGDDGRATVEITPERYGTHVLTVQAIDRTLNRSTATAYEFTVLNRDPRVFDQNPDAGVGEPRVIRFWSAVPGTASFTYRLNDGPAATADADAAGWAEATVTPDRAGANLLAVTSRTADGVVSPEVVRTLYVPEVVTRS